MTSDSNTNCITMETIEPDIADEYLGNLILITINTIQENRKRPETSSIHEYLQKIVKQFQRRCGNNREYIIVSNQEK